MKHWQTRGTLRNLELKNRIIFPAVTGNWASPAGGVTDKILRFYGDIAEGGCAMIVVSGTAVTPGGKSSDRSLVLDDAGVLPGYAALANRISSHACLAGIQLMHVGGQGNPRYTGTPPVSPSGGFCSATGFEARALALPEIEEIRDQFIRSAGMAITAGFKTIELHLAHGYLLHEFLTPRKNRRDDRYGIGTREGTLLLREIVEGIRNRDPDVVLGARVSAEDFVAGGLRIESIPERIAMLEEMSFDYFSVTAGTYESSRDKHLAMSEGRFFQFSSRFKKYAKVPVIGGGKLLDLSMAEWELSANTCDFVAIGRGLIADPRLVRSTEDGAAINRCNECGQCHYLRHGTPHLTCSIREIPDA